ncbi:MAG: hypothetical protein ABIB71_05195 [Candidatus Woesearchaeota archaeon]
METLEEKISNYPKIKGIMAPTKEELSTFNYKQGQKGIIAKIFDLYFRPKPFERSCKIYTWLGVRHFKNFVMATVGAIFRVMGANKGTGNYFIGQQERSINTLKKFDYWTRFNETIHSSVLPFSAYGTVSALENGNYTNAAVNGFLFLLNASLVMVQRYNRARVYNTIDSKITQATLPTQTIPTPQTSKISKL